MVFITPTSAVTCLTAY